jgi:hypothetical protein
LEPSQLKGSSRRVEENPSVEEGVQQPLLPAVVEIEVRQRGVVAGTRDWNAQHTWATIVEGTHGSQPLVKVATFLTTLIGVQTQKDAWGE